MSPACLPLATTTHDDTTRKSHAHAHRSYLPCGFDRSLFKYKLHARARALGELLRLSWTILRLADVSIRWSKEDQLYRFVIIIAKRPSVIDDFRPIVGDGSTIESHSLCLLCFADNDHYAIVMARDCRSTRSSRVKPPHPFYTRVYPRSTYRCINFSEDMTKRHNNLPGYLRTIDIDVWTLAHRCWRHCGEVVVVWSISAVPFRI